VSAWRQIRGGFRTLWRRESADAELSSEIASYIEDATAEHVARGLTPEAARRAAQVEAGSTTAIQDHVRQSAWENAAETLSADVKFGARQLMRNPGFAIVAIVTLALGIGATTAIFSAVNPILFKPLPYPHASRVMMIWEARTDDSFAQPAYGTFYGLTRALEKDQARTVAYAAALKPWQPAMAGEGEPERFEGQRVTAEYFRTLGVEPALGRDFTAADDAFQGPNVAIVSNRLWKRRFASDPGIVGRHLTLDGNLFTVIGVMPARFENVLAPAADIWAPLQYNPALPADGREWGHHLRVVGRLAAGANAGTAANELTTDLEPLTVAYAKGYASSGGAPRGISVHALQDDLTADVRPALLAILGAVLLVLLIACINVTNLVLARGAQRRPEFAMRTALGAGRGRLIRQLLVEGLLLALVGGAIGLLLARLGVSGIVALSPADLPRAAAIRIDSSVLLFALGVTTAVGVLVGLLPALYASRNDPQSGLRDGARTTVGGHHVARRALVIAEVSISLVLLVGAGLLLRSIRNVFSVNPGFDPAGLLSMQVQDAGRRTTDDARARYYESALEAARAVPGVEAAAFTSQLPLSGDADVYGMEFAAMGNGASSDAAYRYSVSPGYFETMRIPLRRGRYLNESDKPGAPRAVVISESLANKFFPHADPIGQRVRVGPDAGVEDKPWSVIVGVVGDVKQEGLAVANGDAFYTSTTNWAWVDPAQSLVVRTSGRAGALTGDVKQAIWSVDKDQPIVRVATMGTLVAKSEAQRRFALVLFEAFGLVAVLLAGIGIYGVLSGGVTERTREIGVRAAFGASPANILRLILGQGVGLAAIGVAIGLAGAVGASRVMATLLFGISTLDPVTYVGVTLVLLAIAAGACYLPARRAMRMDPMLALRHE
jgi:putative ABC transport system permease protein